MIQADNPISAKEHDTLGRTKLAETLASEVRALDVSSGCVVGILGPWGSGKTSLLNLIRNELTTNSPSLSVLDFNPWMFSGADELIQSFFIEIGAQFRSRGDRLAQLADDVEAYGEVLAPLRLLPVVGLWVERVRGVARAVRQALERRKGGALAKRAELSKRLAELSDPIVLVIDDIDRLQTGEIREIFKLVRLTASFPNVIYLLAFDRHRVEIALSEDGLVGRDYLEKILQVAHDLPAVPEAELTSLLIDSLDIAINDLKGPRRFDSRAWPDVLFELIRPLISNMRDVRRYVASVHATLKNLEGRIAMVDVLGLDAIRVFLPDVFAHLQSAREALTTPSPAVLDVHEPPHLRASVEKLLASSPASPEVVRAVITRLFPAARRHIENMHYGSDFMNEWLRDRRVAHPEILKLYLERIVGEQVAAFDLAEQAFAVLDDERALSQSLGALDGDQLAETLLALKAYEEEFPPVSVEPACVVILNQMPRVKERGAGLFSVRPDVIVSQVVLRLLKRIEDPKAVESVVRRILPRVETLSARGRLLLTVGYRENAGQKLIPQDAARELERDHRADVRAADAASLAREPDLLRLLVRTQLDAEPSEPPLDPPQGAELDAAILKAAVRERKSQMLGSRLVSREKGLDWDLLVQISGGEEAVKQMVNRIEVDDADAELAQALELTGKYLEGWRPTDEDE